MSAGLQVTGIAKRYGATVALDGVDDEALSLWDAPVNTPALRWGI